MSIYLCIVYGCFRTTIEELSSCNRDYTASPPPQAQNIYCVALYRESLPETPLTY